MAQIPSAPIFFAAVVVTIVVGVALALLAARRRRERWQTLASSLHLAYAREDDTVVTRFSELRLFDQGRSRSARNVLSGSHQGGRLWLFDYDYLTGAGKNRMTHGQTLCIVEWAKLELAPFLLRRRVPFLDSLASVPGGTPIALPEDAEFSELFVLQGDDAAAIRAQLGAREVRRHFVQSYRQALVHCEGKGQRLLVGRGHLLPPEKARELVVETMTLAGLLAADRRAVAG